jgi:type VI protein secretion system component VasF
MSQRPRRRWVSEAEDPALEAQLQRELEQRRQARIDDRRRRRYERREGLLFWFFALLLAGLVGLIGYGVVLVTQSVLG